LPSLSFGFGGAICAGPTAVTNAAISPSTVTASQCLRSDSAGSHFFAGPGCGSTEAVFNEASGAIDFRVESNGNANMLKIDGTNDKVGIGTASPATVLDVEGAAQFGSGATKSTFTATGNLQIAGTLTLTAGATIQANGGTLSLSTSTTSGTPAVTIAANNKVYIPAGNGSASGVGKIKLYILTTSSATLAISAQQDVGTYTLPANTLVNVGDTVYVVCYGTMTASSTAKVYSVTFGGTTLIGASATNTAAHCSASTSITKTASNAQIYHADRWIGGSSGNIAQINGNAAITDTSDITITCAGSAATAAAGDITTTGMMVWYSPAP